MKIIEKRPLEGKAPKYVAITRPRRFGKTVMANMIGILPIAKYSNGSELNMFFEFSMAARTKYSKYFGFTDEEVDALYEKYLQTEISPTVTREGLKL